MRTLFLFLLSIIASYHSASYHLASYHLLCHMIVSSPSLSGENVDVAGTRPPRLSGGDSPDFEEVPSEDDTITSDEWTQEDAARTWKWRFKSMFGSIAEGACAVVGIAGSWHFHPSNFHARCDWVFCQKLTTYYLLYTSIL